MFNRQSKAPQNPKRIIFTLVNGEKSVVSKKVYTDNGPMNQDKDANVQLSLIMENMMYFTDDDGTVVMTKHIVTARIEEYEE